MKGSFVSEKIIASIVLNAYNLQERLAQFHFDENQTFSSAVATSQLENWCQHVADGDWQKFEKRLAVLGLNINSARSFLDTKYTLLEQALPVWATLLQEVAETSLDWSIANSQNYLDPAQPLPFEEVLAPFIQIARKRLIQTAGTSYHLLTPAAHKYLENELLQQLSNLAAPSLWLEFASYRLKRQPSFLFKKDSPFTRPEEPVSRTIYEAFIQKLLEDGLLSFFEEYSTLARLLCTRMEFWIEAKAEFLERLYADQTIISRTFHACDFPVVEIKSGLSDSHHNGRTVMQLSLANGLKLIYKPRNVDIEQTFQRFLEWCSNQGCGLNYKLLKIINRPAYGWVEFVASENCQSEAQVRLFYRRMGGLLTILYAMGGTDYHYENLIASGEFPVLIDQEALFYPQIEVATEIQEAWGNLQGFTNSVLNVGLLPTWKAMPDGKSRDVSALNGGEAQSWTYSNKQWQAINSDAMQFSVAKKTSNLEQQPNRLQLNGKLVNPANYREDFVAGFEQMYLFLFNQRLNILKQGGPLENFRNLQTRFFFRKTQLYYSVIQSSSSSKFMRAGIDHSFRLDVLSKALLLSPNNTVAWQILDIELRQLEKADIPVFKAYTNSCDLFDADEELLGTQNVQKFFSLCGYDRVANNFRELNEEDMQRQSAYIKAAFYAMSLQQTESHVSHSLENIDWDSGAIRPLTKEQLLAQAEAIGAELERQSIKTGSSVTWLYLGYDATINHYQLNPLNYSLYSGVGGVALFLTMLGKLTGEIKYHKLAKATWRPLLNQLQASGAGVRLARSQGLGGGLGSGSMIYALVRCGQFLDDDSFVKAARQVATFTADQINADKHFDVMFGVGGTILGLLALYAQTGEEFVLEQALKCGQHLLKTQTTSETGQMAWPTVEEKFLAGFSHGAAGIAFALLKLFEVCGDTAYLQAANAAIAYEASIFSEEAQNWPHLLLSHPGKPAFWNSWCHGATGIGLARLGGLAISDNPQAIRDVQTALLTTQNWGLRQLDHVCCGNLGRVDFLLTAAQRLKQPALLATAQQWTAAIVSRAQQQQQFQLFAGEQQQLDNPSFFQGTSGIGYQFLRLAEPSLVPSVLLFE